MGKLKCAFLLGAFCLFWNSRSQFKPFTNQKFGFTATFDEPGIQISLEHPQTGVLFHSHRLGLDLDKISKSAQRKHVCAGPEKEFPDKFSVEWPDIAKVEVTLSDDEGQGVQCYNVAWVSTASYFRPLDCFSLGKAHWYGGAEVLEQRWPIETQRSKMQPYLTGDFLSPYWRMKSCYGKYGSIVEPYWVSSSGFAIRADEDITLHSSFNAEGDGQLCLRSDRRAYVMAERDVDFHERLNYTVCRGKNILHVHKYISDRYIPRPTAIPDKRMFQSPIWSTWARYKVNVSQKFVLEYAKEIKQYGFSNSQLEIDDKYTTEYGEFDFDAVKFPNATEMVSQLHKLGYRVTAWVTPFANLESKAFLEGAKQSYWMRTRPPHSVPSVTRWWQGVGGILDVSNPDAVNWYLKRLSDFQRQHKIDSWKFDAGEIDFFPFDIDLPPGIVSTNRLTNLYIKMTEQFGGMVEVRSGYRSQDANVFFRMLDKDSVWGYDNGLRSLIPTALLMSIIGYPFILPDMIGGNGYSFVEPLKTTTLPDKELFVRWLQLSAFLPSMQFSIAPWQYDDEVVKISQKYVELHEKFVTPEILKAAEITLKTGEPIIRPLWWIDQSEESLAIDTQFLIGESILVAPVVDKGVRSRDVYLPGENYKWKDLATESVLQGGQWVKGVSAKLDQVPVFVKIT